MPFHRKCETSAHRTKSVPRLKHASLEYQIFKIKHKENMQFTANIVEYTKHLRFITMILCCSLQFSWEFTLFFGSEQTHTYHTVSNAQGHFIVILIVIVGYPFSFQFLK